MKRCCGSCWIELRKTDASRRPFFCGELLIDDIFYNRLFPLATLLVYMYTADLQYYLINPFYSMEVSYD